MYCFIVHRCVPHNKRDIRAIPADAAMPYDEDEDFSPECDVRTTDLIRSNRYCGLITDERTIFRRCIRNSKSKPEQIYETCLFDACANAPDEYAMKAVACAALEVFSVQCESLGYSLNWRHVARCGKYNCTSRTQ